MQLSITILSFLPMALASWSNLGTCRDDVCAYDTEIHPPEVNCPDEWHYSDSVGDGGRTSCKGEGKKSTYQMECGLSERKEDRWGTSKPARGTT